MTANMAEKSPQHAPAVTGSADDPQVRKGYKWIAKEIERLDPYVDYERIWELSTCYYVGDFEMNFLYSTGFPHFILPPWGGETIARQGTGKFIKQMNKREKDTADAFWKWFENGPSSMATKESVEKVNKIHMAIEKKMPGNFSHNEDFVYTMCWIGADLHRLRLRIGLPGYTDNQKIAVHLYWQELSKLMRSANGAITDFPVSFEAMLDYMREYEQTDWEFSPEGAVTCDYTIKQFSERWFPRGFRWVGRKMLLAMWDEPVHRVHRQPEVSFLTRKFFEFGLRMVFTMQERVLPDPKLSTPAKKRLKAQGGDKPPIASAA